MARRNFDERRQAIARARGFPVSYEDARGVIRHPTNAYYQYRVTVAGWTAPNRRTRSRSGEEMTYSRDEGSIAAAIRRAAADDMRIYARVTMLLDPEDGSHPKTWPRHNVELWARGGWDASSAEAAMDGYGMAIAMLKDEIDKIEKYSGVLIDVLIRAVP